MRTRNFWLALLFTLTWSATASAQITVTYTFTNGTTADADQVNTNFTQLATQSLNRAGGTITGNISVDPGITIDGVDVGTQACTTCSPTFATVTISGGITAGSGAVGIVDGTGKIPALSSTYFASISGANLTSLNATNLTSGLVSTARGGLGLPLGGVLGGEMLYANGIGTFTVLGIGATGTMMKSNGAAPTWTTDGSTLTALNATQLTTGTVPAGRISGTYASAVTFSSGSNAFTGAYSSADGTAGVTCTSPAAPVFKNGILVGGC